MNKSYASWSSLHRRFTATVTSEPVSLKQKDITSAGDVSSQAHHETVRSWKIELWKKQCAIDFFFPTILQQTRITVLIFLVSRNKPANLLSACLQLLHWYYLPLFNCNGLEQQHAFWVFLRLFLTETHTFLKNNKPQWSLYVPHSGHYMYRTVVTVCTAQWSLYVPHSGHCMYRTVVTICTAQWSLYVPPYLTLNNSTFCPRSVFMCFLWISEQTAIISPYSIKQFLL